MLLDVYDKNIIFNVLNQKNPEDEKTVSGILLSIVILLFTANQQAQTKAIAFLGDRNTAILCSTMWIRNLSYVESKSLIFQGTKKKTIPKAVAKLMKKFPVKKLKK